MIKAKVLSDYMMRSIGFTDYNPKKWYFCRRFNYDWDVTFNFTIDKDTGEYEIFALDENFGQPYPYKNVKTLRDQMNEYIQYFKDVGVLVDGE